MVSKLLLKKLEPKGKEPTGVRGKAAKEPDHIMTTSPKLSLILTITALSALACWNKLRARMARRSALMKFMVTFSFAAGIGGKG